MTETLSDDLPLSRDQIRFLAKSYHTLEYSPALRSLLSKVFTDTDFSQYSKINLHRCLNAFLTTKYAGEIALKYHLFCRAARKKLVAAFEIRVENSRVDFLTINGVSVSFEIKSELDRLDKLVKQASNYIKVFEYNYAVIDPRHKSNALKMLPLAYGIVHLAEGKRTIEREATANMGIDSGAQLNMLTKKELSKAFANYTGRREIQNRFTDHAINIQFKEALKSRYRNRWNFVVRHRKDILPIDLQFFFNRNIDPELIYNYG